MHSKDERWQDGFVYVRMKRIGIPNAPKVYATLNPINEVDDYSHIILYLDEGPAQRVAASRRVERALEEDDYRQRCIEHGYSFEHRTYRSMDKWRVYHVDFEVEADDDCALVSGEGDTLREAYWRCHNRMRGTYGMSKRRTRKWAKVAGKVTVFTRSEPKRDVVVLD